MSKVVLEGLTDVLQMVMIRNTLVHLVMHDIRGVMRSADIGKHARGGWPRGTKSRSGVYLAREREHVYCAPPGSELVLLDSRARDAYRKVQCALITEFYGAFTAFNPNCLVIHALRRRQLSHGFSQVSIQKLEPLIEGQMEIFIRKLRSLVGSGETFDFKTIISLYILDILGEVAFAKPFGVQEKGYAEELHAINDHLLLAGVIRELTFQNFWKALSRMSPVSWMRQLMKSRNNLKTVCSDCVKFKMKNTSQRPDLLKSLVEAADPQCGARLTEQEINSEAFAVL
ncbi:hypothetical protein N7481_008341 [Penicillium waksmanii]|uniref:uncharacterized protein n=1 Tax=Penicillium waksmanii TaxID=69791 RepID=UPI0025487B4B|nr:uncharacterized protein N7481_008341 [Penicillium waksmanii]KAJ5981043.1 hypothetical protein N7481_008341 [Penicillium waksmanii]